MAEEGWNEYEYITKNYNVITLKNSCVFYTCNYSKNNSYLLAIPRTYSTSCVFHNCNYSKRVHRFTSLIPSESPRSLFVSTGPAPVRVVCFCLSPPVKQLYPRYDSSYSKERSRANNYTTRRGSATPRGKIMLPGVLATLVQLCFIEPVPQTGPYDTASRSYTFDALDSTSKEINVVFPVSHEERMFPIIVYAHGFDDRGTQDYGKLFKALASWGYVVVCALSCYLGCKDDCVTLPDDPPCFGHYYHQQLLTIGWAQSNATAALPIDRSVGVGIAGHSMGGQATLFSASDANATVAYDIRAAVMHHAFTHRYPAVHLPFAAFTGTFDFVASPNMTEHFFNAAGAHLTRGMVNKRLANHHEPSTDYNPMLGTYTAAWFKLFLDGTPKSLGVDWNELIYGRSNRSICHGGDGAMPYCEMLGGHDLKLQRSYRTVEADASMQR